MGFIDFFDPYFSNGFMVPVTTARIERMQPMSALRDTPGVSNSKTFKL